MPLNFIGRIVTVRFDSRLVKVFFEEKAVAVHMRVAAGSYVLGSQQNPEQKHPRQQSYFSPMPAKAERIGPDAHIWAKAAEEHRGVRAYRLIQGMLSFSRKHPKERINWACGVAQDAGQYRYRTLVRLLDQAKEKSTNRMSLIQSHELIRPLTDYSGSSAKMRFKRSLESRFKKRDHGEQGVSLLKERR